MTTVSIIGKSLILLAFQCITKSSFPHQPMGTDFEFMDGSVEGHQPRGDFDIESDFLPNSVNAPARTDTDLDDPRSILRVKDESTLYKIITDAAVWLTPRVGDPSFAKSLRENRFINMVTSDGQTPPKLFNLLNVTYPEMVKDPFLIPKGLSFAMLRWYRFQNDKRKISHPNLYAFESLAELLTDVRADPDIQKFRRYDSMICPFLWLRMLPSL